MLLKKKSFSFIPNLIFTILSLCFIIPIWSLVSISLSNEADIIKFGYRLWPVKVDLAAYDLIFENPDSIINAYKVTVIISFAGLFIYLFMASMIAYSISRSDFKYKKAITFYCFFTMLFNGGLVPYYILMTQYLNVRNTYAALILPLLGNVWYIFIMKTFFQQLPDSIIESATIDGAGELQIYAGIILPLSKPVLATVGFMQLLFNWNSWFPALLFIDKDTMYTLQYLLQTVLRNIIEITQNLDNKPAYLVNDANLPTESMRMAMAIVAVGPMLFVFPFFQKYFVRGLTVGSVKG